MPPPELMDELVEEVLLRFPPQEPACLVRAAIVCKRWRRLVSDPSFRRRFREFHSRPSMLGFLCNHRDARDKGTARFVPTSTTSSSCFQFPRAGDCYRWRVDDARHGRVLLSRLTTEHVVLMVWDPITNQRQELPALLRQPMYDMKAAIVCAGAATGTCVDHLDCYRHRGPFLVICMSVFSNDIFTCIYYSSHTAASSEDVFMYLHRQIYYKPFVQSVLVRNSLYYMFHKNHEVLEYDLQLCKIVSVIQLQRHPSWRRVVLLTTEDGELGYATAIGYKLNLWSRKKADSEGDAGWLHSRVIDLDALPETEPLP